MMVAFDFLSKPLEISEGIVNTLCVENKSLFRRLVGAMAQGFTEENNIILSENFKPLDFKNNVAFIYDYLNLSFSSSFMKKIYDDISTYVNNEHQDELCTFVRSAEILFDTIVSDYDMDFEYNSGYSLTPFLKAIDLKPVISTNSLLESLLQYVLITKKYSNIKCLIFANLHSFFSYDELNTLFKELRYNHINILLIESCAVKSVDNEKVIIVDNDLCEIVEN